MKPVPLLARIRVATPCRADWNQMTGDERVRHCASCKKNVFNLSEMSREQAERLIIEKNGDLCARYYQRHDGTILLADCSVGLADKRKTRVVAAGAMALLAGTPVAALSLRMKAHAPKPPEPVITVTGVMVVDPPAPPPPAPPKPEEATEIMGGMPAPDYDEQQREQLAHARAELKKQQAEHATAKHTAPRHASHRPGERPSNAPPAVDKGE